MGRILLKNIENNYYKNLLQGRGIEATQQNIDLFRETTEKTEELKMFRSPLLLFRY